MNAMLRICAILGLLLWSQSSRADSEAPPTPIVTASEDGRCFFKMVPAKQRRRGRRMVTEREAFGAAYRIDDDGNITELWKTSGWYSFEVLLSADGRYLVRIGSFGVGQKPEKRDLGVEFYKDGKLLKRYSTSDLVKDNRKVIETASHYMWLARDNDNYERPDPDAKLTLDWDKVFRLKTIDGILYEFDATTGQIKKARNR